MTSDVFYDPHPDGVARWGRRGYLCVEMETAAVYLIAMRERAKGRPVRAGSILTVSDIIVDPSVAAGGAHRRQRDVVPAARGRGHPARGPHDRRGDGGGRRARPGLMPGTGMRRAHRVARGSVTPGPRARGHRRRPRQSCRRLRAPTRFSWLGIALLGGAAVIAFVVTFGVFLPALGEIGRMGQDPASLPRQLTVCDRTWDRGQDVRVWTLEEVTARDDREPIVVTASVPGVCPAGACGAVRGGRGLCHGDLRAKGQDEYVRYDLVTDQ